MVKVRTRRLRVDKYLQLSLESTIITTTITSGSSFATLFSSKIGATKVIVGLMHATLR